MSLSFESELEALIETAEDAAQAEHPTVDFEAFPDVEDVELSPSCPNPDRFGHSCGKCELCLRKRRSRIATQIWMECQCWPYCLFVTLTYNDECVPITEKGFLSLRRKHLTDYLKRLRRRVERTSDVRVRFQATGEYGARHRPHYHLILFGLTKADEEQIRAAWQLGFVDVQVVRDNQHASWYVSKHQVKPEYSKGSSTLAGREPEFSTRSKNPGLGHDFAKRIASCYESPAGQRYLDENGDVRPVIGVGKGQYRRIPRYILQLVRAELGIAQTHQERGTTPDFVRGRADREALQRQADRAGRKRASRSGTLR